MISTCWYPLQSSISFQFFQRSREVNFALKPQKPLVSPAGGNQFQTRADGLRNSSAARSLRLAQKLRRNFYGDFSCGCRHKTLSAPYPIPALSIVSGGERRIIKIAWIFAPTLKLRSCHLAIFRETRSPRVPYKIEVMIGVSQLDLQIILVHLARDKYVSDSLEFFNRFIEIRSHDSEV